MKKLFLFSVAALAFCACSSDEVVSENSAANQQPKAISFAPLTKPNTRAAADTYQYAIDGTEFPHDLNMYVAAYQVQPTATNYFAGTQFVYNNAGGAAGSSAKWGGATARYWPLSPCYINFLAYANVAGTAAFDATNYASKAVITQNDNSSAQTDLMYAIGHGEVTQSSNALTFPEKVDMQFKHAQAWMDFYVKAKTNTEKTIKINSITLKGAKYAGTYTITHTNYNSNTSQSVAGTWTPSGDAKDVVVPGWTAADLTTDFVQVGKGLLIVPDNDASTNDWTSFVINYTLDGKDYDYEYTAPAAPNATVAQATHYVFNITFTLHEIFVDATIADWTDENNYVDVPTTTIAYNESTPATFTATAAGTYTFTITGVPANGGSTYDIVSADSGDDIIASVAKAADTTPASGETTGTVTVTVKLKAATGTKALKLKLGDTEKMTINVTRS